jgi:hypothetical protein
MFDISEDAPCVDSAFQLNILGFVVLQHLVGLLYACSWYLDLSWSVQAPLRKASKLMTVLTVSFSLAYASESLLCMVLSLLLRPQESTSTLIMIGTPVVYGIVAMQELLAIYHATNKGKADNQFALADADDVLDKELGLDFDEEKEKDEEQQHAGDYTANNEVLPLSSIVAAVGGGVLVLSGRTDLIHTRAVPLPHCQPSRAVRITLVGRQWLPGLLAEARDAAAPAGPELRR